MYGRYETLFESERRFQVLLSDVYYDVLIFLRRAKQICSTSGRKHPISFVSLTDILIALVILIRGIWKTFEMSFQETLHDLARHRLLLEAEATLCHREHVEAEIKEQARYRKRPREGFTANGQDAPDHRQPALERGLYSLIAKCSLEATIAHCLPCKAIGRLYCTGLDRWICQMTFGERLKRGQIILADGSWTTLYSWIGCMNHLRDVKSQTKLQ